MMPLRKHLVAAALVTGLALALIGLGVWTLRAGEQPVHASHDSVTQTTPGEDVAIDMIVSGNGSGSLGAIDPCVSTVDVGSIITFDVVLDGIPSGQNLSGFNFKIQPLPGDSLAGLTVTARSNLVAGVNILT